MKPGDSSVARATDVAKLLQQLLPHVGNKPIPLARLARLLLAMGHDATARELGANALALAPNSGEVQAISAEIFSHEIASWYFPMVQDHLRHAAMEHALKRAITPASRVLEIGTGTALFAMMAARAGAKEVFTCEKDPVVAATAAEIVAANGLSDRVRVIAKSSTDLEVGIDLTGPADVLIWDTLGSNMIGAGALPILENAKRRLVRSGASVIPARGRIRVALAEDRKFHRKRMRVVEGFDLTPFNKLASPSYVLDVGDERLVLRSRPKDLFTFDFQSGGPFPEASASLTLRSSGGVVNGIAQWLRLELDDETSYESQPGRGASSVFNVVFHTLKQPIELKAGTTIVVSATHDRMSFRIWADAA
jgi:predicted O-methyltransferase YrrM